MNKNIDNNLENSTVDQSVLKQDNNTHIESSNEIDKKIKSNKKIENIMLSILFFIGAASCLIATILLFVLVYPYVEGSWVLICIFIFIVALLVFGYFGIKFILDRDKDK